MKAFSLLVQRHLDERGWNRKDLAASHAPRNQSAALRKITELLNGGKVRRGLMDSICVTLNIDPAERKAAQEEDRLAWLNSIEEFQRQQFTPHVWIEVIPGWFPSLVTILGAGFFRKVPAPDDLLAAQGDEQIIAIASEFVVRHFNSTERRVNRDEVNHYLFRCSFDVGYRFTPHGQFVEKLTTPILAPMTAARVR
ncbi:MAG: hypothetical protein K1X78_20280 [Verrucomicrobiaceae bacterium]|nr:hypothetical protein [Verrucomicrobiaceae bacterium]